MKTFEIKFKHTIEETYIATVDAESKEEAKELFEESPFDYVEDQNDPLDVQGLSLVISNIEEVVEEKDDNPH